ncbi:uncharacterized protein CANTADRAFT_110028 [Suhomyces tanzawaensis NRRL Y-17324]|uniref:Uncharacterized protein n=1 Tax=Suhomyces tanzawaensis NRRL Y-17324 TaxID=984487 RepID=A0A1E4SPZ3_9ASCO|nr:uncharacterized protein CANTADRAFT_110028 [Suhomyces tanzawaensis NRRL Y-17324]ODV81482.1 hypothetical protein CANTADRAFT_110028 [Suhomyces tanzawaensis NRRL Y-17324]
MKVAMSSQIKTKMSGTLDQMVPQSYDESNNWLLHPSVEVANTTTSSVPSDISTVSNTFQRHITSTGSNQLTAVKMKSGVTENILSFTESRPWGFKSSPKELEYRDGLKQIFNNGVVPVQTGFKTLLEQLLARLDDYEIELLSYQQNLELQQQFLQEKTNYLNRYQRVLFLREQELGQLVRRMHATEALIELKTTIVSKKSVANIRRYESTRLNQFVNVVEMAVKEFKSYDNIGFFDCDVLDDIEVIERWAKGVLMGDVRTRILLREGRSELFLKN